MMALTPTPTHRSHGSRAPLPVATPKYLQTCIRQRSTHALPRLNHSHTHIGHSSFIQATFAHCHWPTAPPLSLSSFSFTSTTSPGHTPPQSHLPPHTCHPQPQPDATPLSGSHPSTKTTASPSRSFGSAQSLSRPAGPGLPVIGVNRQGYSCRWSLLFRGPRPSGSLTTYRPTLISEQVTESDTVTDSHSQTPHCTHRSQSHTQITLHRSH